MSYKTRFISYIECKEYEIEQGVKRLHIVEEKYRKQNGDIFVYQLREMTDEAIERYNLKDTYERIKRYGKSKEV